MQSFKTVTSRPVVKSSRVPAGLPAMAAKPATKSPLRSAVIVRADIISDRDREGETPAVETKQTEPIAEPVKFEPLAEQLVPVFEAAEGIEYSVGGQRWQELMAFQGFAPEVINGRLAMLGFVAAAGAELTTGQTFMTQFGNNFLPVMFHLALFAGASIAPAIATGKSLPELVKEATGQEAAGFGGNGFPEQLQKLTPEVELMNGRAAMVGIAGMIVVEGIKGSAIF